MEDKNICVDKNGQLILTFNYDLLASFVNKNNPDTITIPRENTGRIYLYLKTLEQLAISEGKAPPWVE